ncbi:MAG TPA: hypothetical protein VFE03_09605 [Caulobacteraceae bacterium]|jgi:hypothetical protein|nr:hypothetical protein [Caulobacteraceae bacterium]
MAEIAVGEAITAGFSVIRRQPAAVLFWGAAQLAFTALIVSVLAPLYIAMFSEAARAAASGEAPDPLAFQGAAMQMQGLSMLLNLLGAAVGAVVYCAVFRSVLHPEQSRWGYLRVGSAELYTLVLMVAAYICVFIAALMLAIPIGIIIAILAVAKAAAAAVIFAIIAIGAVIVAAIYVGLRFSLAVPMMVEDGQFHLMESWALTKGKTSQLFVIGLATVALLIAAEIGVLIVMGLLGFAGLAAIVGGMANWPDFFKQPPRLIFGKLAPLLAVFAVLWVPFAGCAYAIWGAPWAKAYRDLVQPDVTGTFS